MMESTGQILQYQEYDTFWMFSVLGARKIEVTFWAKQRVLDIMK